MRIHHLNCGSMCPIGSRLFPGVFPPEICCHCLLIETNDGLVLVDTGLGTQDMEDPSRLGPTRFLLGVERRPELPALRQIEAMGFTADDVRHVVLTHLDIDHAGGLPDFPKATAHVLADELAAARDTGSLASKSRYVPIQFENHVKWSTHTAPDGEPWFGFDAVRQIEGLPPELLLVPLLGHSRGHMGVAVDSDEGWKLHAGDAYYGTAELAGGGPIGIKVMQAFVNDDNKLASRNRDRLAQLIRDEPDIEVFCAHDPDALNRLAAPQARPDAAQ